MRGAARVLCALFLAASLSGCALFISDPEERAEVIEINDPLEGVNRHIFAVNLALDTFILRPVSVVYREFVPEPGQDMVRNFVQNLKLPFTAINDLLQGETDRAETAISRFLVNTTAGVGGLFDAATGLGLEYHEEDFGQTLAVHGSEEGPYLMLPIFGPSNLRDAIGLVVQYFTDPVGIAADEAGADNFGFVRGGMEAVDTRARNLETFDTLQQQSLDFYAAIRSLYRQRRAAEIRNFEEDALPGRPFVEKQADPETAAETVVAEAPVPEKEPEAPVEASVAAYAAADSTAPALPTQVEPAAQGATTSAAMPAAESAPAPASMPAPARPDVLERRLDHSPAQDISTPAPAAPEGARSPHASAVGTQLAEAAEPEGRSDRFAEALRAFEEAARSFDEVAGTSSR